MQITSKASAVTKIDLPPSRCCPLTIKFRHLELSRLNFIRALLKKKHQRSPRSVPRFRQRKKPHENLDERLGSRVPDLMYVQKFY